MGERPIANQSTLGHVPLPLKWPTTPCGLDTVTIPIRAPHVCSQYQAFKTVHVWAFMRCRFRLSGIFSPSILVSGSNPKVYQFPSPYPVIFQGLSNPSSGRICP
ncbi:hypothetical protein SLA2020_459230 [Shorea laevis]